MRRIIAIAAILAATAAGVTAWAVTRPDPVTQAAADGCTGTGTQMLTQAAPSWVYVNDKDSPPTGPPPPPQWVHGVVNSPVSYLASHPTSIDNPVVHDSYDLNLNILPDAADANLLGTHNLVGEGEETGRLHTEREQLYYLSFAWPEQGDRVQMLGSWIWDCVHDNQGGVRSELHPFRAIWIQRAVAARSPYGESEGDLFISTEKSNAGKQEDCAHKLRPDFTTFKACVGQEPNWQTVNGDYTFTLPMPRKPSPASKPIVRVVDQGSSAGAPKVTVNGTTVSLSINAPAGQRVVVAKEVFLGWTHPSAAALPQHLRLQFESFLFRRAMDPGCPTGQTTCQSVETTRYGQTSSGPGEWAIYTDVGGIWSPWQPQVIEVTDGEVLKSKRSVDLYVPKGKPWRLFVFPRECDFGTVSASDPSRPPAPCPRSHEFGDLNGDDDPGAVVSDFASPARSLGEHKVNAMLADSTCPPSNTLGCWQLTYRVIAVNDAAQRAAARR